LNYDAWQGNVTGGATKSQWVMVPVKWMLQIVFEKIKGETSPLNSFLISSRELMHSSVKYDTDLQMWLSHTLIPEPPTPVLSGSEPLRSLLRDMTTRTLLDAPAKDNVTSKQRDEERQKRYGYYNVASSHGTLSGSGSRKLSSSDKRRMDSL
jgi:hypothetical protein